MSHSSEMWCPDEVADLTPSAKLVYVLVVWRGPMTTGELANCLPERTVRLAVERLNDAGAITVESPADAPNSRLIRAA